MKHEAVGVLHTVETCPHFFAMRAGYKRRSLHANYARQHTADSLFLLLVNLLLINVFVVGRQLTLKQNILRSGLNKQQVCSTSGRRIRARTSFAITIMKQTQF